MQHLRNPHGHPKMATHTPAARKGRDPFSAADVRFSIDRVTVISGRHNHVHKCNLNYCIKIIYVAALFAVDTVQVAIYTTNLNNII